VRGCGLYSLNALLCSRVRAILSSYRRIIHQLSLTWLRVLTALFRPTRRKSPAILGGLRPCQTVLTSTCAPDANLHIAQPLAPPKAHKDKPKRTTSTRGGVNPLYWLAPGFVDQRFIESTNSGCRGSARRSFPASAKAWEQPRGCAAAWVLSRARACKAVAAIPPVR
jgi:hypothetical protein